MPIVHELVVREQHRRIGGIFRALARRKWLGLGGMSPAPRGILVLERFVERVQQKRQKRHVVGERHAAQLAVLLLQRMANTAVHLAVTGNLLRRKLLLICHDVAEHTLLRLLHGFGLALWAHHAKRSLAARDRKLLPAALALEVQRGLAVLPFLPSDGKRATRFLGRAQERLVLAIARSDVLRVGSEERIGQKRQRRPREQAHMGENRQHQADDACNDQRIRQEVGAAPSLHGARHLPLHPLEKTLHPNVHPPSPIIEEARARCTGLESARDAS